MLEETAVGTAADLLFKEATFMFAKPLLPPPRTPLEELMSHAYQVMMVRGTGYHTIYETCRYWRQIQAYAAHHAVETFTPAFAEEYLATYQRRSEVSSTALRATKHAVRILQEFQQRGTWDRYPVHLKEPIRPFASPGTPLETMMAQAYQAMEGQGYQPSTLAATVRRWLQYARFVEERGEEALSPTWVDAFLEAYRDASPDSQEFAARAMRALLAFQEYGYWRKYLLPRQESPLLFDPPQTPLEAVIARAYQAMVAQGYSAGTLTGESRYWRHFVYYAETQGADTLSSALVDAYLTRLREDPTVPHSHVKGSTRVLRRLLEFAEFGAWRRYPASHHEAALTSATFAAARERFLQYWQTERQVARNTYQYGRRYTYQFLHYLEAEGAREWGDLSGPLIGRFISENPAWSSGARQLVVSTVRGFLRYLFVQGEMDRDWSGSLPTVCRGPKRKLPVIWTPEELTALLAAVERSSAVGKRDYAILLLASRLGMRASDIRTLRLEDIHWESARLEFLQAKTGKQIILPLPTGVGEALIVYLREGRPHSPPS
ncbi:MAG: tyrosine-type recombinase/integrase [Armatimonadota bacterium]